MLHNANEVRAALAFWKRTPRKAETASAGLRALLRSVPTPHLLTACLFLCLMKSPAQAQTASGLASADAARLTAPNLSSIVAAWKRMLEASRELSDGEKLKAVNSFFNQRLLFADDAVVWGQPDHWATPAEFMDRGRGDCEDFAIAKYVSLRMLGVSSQKLRLMYVHAAVGPKGRIAHMVLGYFPDDSQDPLVLDNMVDSVRQLSARADLAMVYSFNTRGLWVGEGVTSAGKPTSLLARWGNMVARMFGEGTLAAWSPSLMTEHTARAQAVALH